MNKAVIRLDKSRIPSDVNKFDGIDSLEILRDEIFKFGIFKEQAAPEHVYENDFEYLMSKIPAFSEMCTDFIKLGNDYIDNLGTDDRKSKEISEILGIALGLKFTSEALGVAQQSIEKIPTPITKEKYLDYKFLKDGKLYEFETKGTTSSSLSRFVNDITAKKSVVKQDVHFKYGTVAQINKSDNHQASVLHICDDPPTETYSQEDPTSILKHYLSPLSFILDNKYYNKLISFFLGRSRRRIRFSRGLFFGKYVFNNEDYYGDYFDRRLVLETISPFARDGISEDKLFNVLTKNLGKHKIFIGIHVDVLEAIFKKNVSKLEAFNCDVIATQSEHSSVFRDSDGMIIVKTEGEHDDQVVRLFTEDVVKRRLGFINNFEQNKPSQCGSPCRSRELQGKACEIKTYRGSCHFHR